MGGKRQEPVRCLATQQHGREGKGDGGARGDLGEHREAGSGPEHNNTGAMFCSGGAPHATHWSMPSPK